MIERYFLDGRHAMGGEERLVRQAVRRSQDSSSGSGRRRQRVGEGEPDNSFLLLFNDQPGLIRPPPDLPTSW